MVHSARVVELAWEALHCTIHLRRPAAGIAVVTISGRDVGELGDAPLRELGRDVAERGPLDLYIDARAATGVTIDVSSEWAAWMRAQRAGLRSISMLTASRFVQITAAFVRDYVELADRMRLYTDAAAFDAALTEATAARPAE